MVLDTVVTRSNKEGEAVTLYQRDGANIEYMLNEFISIIFPSNGSTWSSHHNTLGILFQFHC